MIGLKNIKNNKRRKESKDKRAIPSGKAFI